MLWQHLRNGINNRTEKSAPMMMPALAIAKSGGITKLPMDVKHAQFFVTGFRLQG